ncbi:hypothetical protein PVL29_017487 [Vitis rotundifolia]|uniref:Flavin-containing monooxygenase n=1 Tax=Vitis rotundifolia TaxID=103349 RepID=A0AA39DII5_VITRO|nr:hypothetical protein PVL29_017487 [Vitis rotundifolia]
MVILNYIFCRYKYHFPFIETNGIVTIDDNRVGPLYKHVFPPRLAPWLSFNGLPKDTPFMTTELQSKWLVHVLSGKVLLPTEEEMMSNIENYYHHMRKLECPSASPMPLPPMRFSIYFLNNLSLDEAISFFDGGNLTEFYIQYLIFIATWIIFVVIRLSTSMEIFICFHYRISEYICLWIFFYVRLSTGIGYLLRWECHHWRSGEE